MVEAGLSPGSGCRLTAFHRRVYECMGRQANAPYPLSCREGIFSAAG